MCCLLESFFFPEKGGPDFNMDTNKLNSLICTTFLFTFLWSMAGNLVETSMDAFDTFARDLFSDTQDVKVNGLQSELLQYSGFQLSVVKPKPKQLQ